MRYRIKTKHLREFLDAAERHDVKTILVDTKKHSINKKQIDFVFKGGRTFDYVSFTKKGKRDVKLSQWT